MKDSYVNNKQVWNVVACYTKGHAHYVDNWRGLLDGQADVAPVTQISAIALVGHYCTSGQQLCCQQGTSYRSGAFFTCWTHTETEQIEKDIRKPCSLCSIVIETRPSFYMSCSAGDCLWKSFDNAIWTESTWCVTEAFIHAFDFYKGIRRTINTLKTVMDAADIASCWHMCFRIVKPCLDLSVWQRSDNEGCRGGGVNV